MKDLITSAGLPAQDADFTIMDWQLMARVLMGADALRYSQRVLNSRATEFGADRNCKYGDMAESHSRTHALICFALASVSLLYSQVGRTSLYGANRR